MNWVHTRWTFAFALRLRGRLLRRRSLLRGLRLALLLAVGPRRGAVRCDRRAQLLAQRVEVGQRVVAAHLEVGDHRLDLGTAALALLDRRPRVRGGLVGALLSVGVGLLAGLLGVLIGRIARLLRGGLGLRDHLRALLL